MMICRRKHPIIYIYIYSFLSIWLKIFWDTIRFWRRINCPTLTIYHDRYPPIHDPYISMYSTGRCFTLNFWNRVSSKINFVLYDFFVTDFISSRSSSSRFSSIKIWSIVEDVLSLIMNLTISIQLWKFFISRSDLQYLRSYWIQLILYLHDFFENVRMIFLNLLNLHTKFLNQDFSND